MKDFSNKYLSHEINKKKIAALANFSETLEKFEDWAPLEIIVRYFNRGFLDKEVQDFLDYLLKKNSVDYLDWCIRTPWVKEMIARGRKPKQGAFYFEDLQENLIDEWKQGNFYLESFKYKFVNMSA